MMMIVVDFRSTSLTISESASASACTITLISFDSSSTVSLFYAIKTASSTTNIVDFFTINGTDVLTCLNNPPGFDFYTRSSYTIVLNGCCDSSGASVTPTISVTITETSEKPTWNSTSFVLSMDEYTAVGTTLVSNMTQYCYARPSSSHGLSFDFVGGSDTYFALTNGELTIEANYSLDVPSLLSSTYTLYIICTDTTYLTSETATIDVIVNDTNSCSPQFNTSALYATVFTTGANEFVATTPATGKSSKIASFFC